MNKPESSTRRSFLKRTIYGLSFIPVGGSFIHLKLRADEADAPKLEETDPTAQALGYVHDASHADIDKFPKRAGPEGAKQFCNNCSLYTGKPGKEWGGCSIFGKKLVNENGWCNAWISE